MDDTIVAIATAPGHAGVAVIRMSGKASLNVASIICNAWHGTQPTPRLAYSTRFVTGDETIDSGLALYFAAPASFTGEDVVELHCHGSPVVLQQLLQLACTFSDVRMAAAGEFSQRAFANGKLDLAQAEAIADLINAGSIAQVRAAQRSLQGEFSQQINALLERIISLRGLTEVTIDFSDQDHGGELGAVQQHIQALDTAVAELLERAQAGVALSSTREIAIVGAPNTGKSSLLNALLECDRAIVSAIAGATRDSISEDCYIAGQRFRITDTAGIRDTTDPLEQQGVARSQQLVTAADVILLVYDGEQTDVYNALTHHDDISARVLAVRNKIDQITPPYQQHPAGLPTLHISVHSGVGMDALQRAISDRLYSDVDTTTCSARARHVTALQHTKTAVAAALRAAQQQHGLEIIAVELRSAQDHLSEITGRFANEDLLDSIFSSFCLGK